MLIILEPIHTVVELSEDSRCTSNLSEYSSSSLIVISTVLTVLQSLKENFDEALKRNDVKAIVVTGRAYTVVDCTG